MFVWSKICVLPRPSSPDRPSTGPRPPDRTTFRCGGVLCVVSCCCCRVVLCCFVVLLCAAPAGPTAMARTRQPENSKRAHFRAPALQKPHQNSTKGPPRERIRKKIVAGREKKREILGPPPFGAPPFGAPPFGTPPFGGPLFLGLSSHLSGPTPKQAHTLRPPVWAHVVLSFLPIFDFVSMLFFCQVCHFSFCPKCRLFCPDNRLLILSRFRFFCPVAFFLSRASEIDVRRREKGASQREVRRGRMGRFAE